MVRGETVELENVRGEGASDGGVRHGRLLVAFAEAVMRDERGDIESTRAGLEAEIGAAGVVDTAAVIAMFNIVDRVADATGIPIDEHTAEFRYGIGEELGMQDQTPEARSAR